MIINKFIVTNQIRVKFLLLLILLFITSSISLYYSLDGLVMMFLISELSIILVFITMFSQLYSYNKENSYQFSFLFTIILLTVNCSFYQTDIISYRSYYSFSNIILNDFYYIYNCYFEKQVILTIITLFIITIYSIFFILIYFSLKTSKIVKNNIQKNFYLLRKQNLTHQVNYNSKIRFFKNEN